MSTLTQSPQLKQTLAAIKQLKDATAVHVFAEQHAGQTVNFQSIVDPTQTMRGTVVGYYYHQHSDKWYVAIDVDPNDPRARYCAVYGSEFFSARRGMALLLKSRYLMAGASVDEIFTYLSTTPAPIENDRYPQTCPRCKGRAYEGAYAYEHKATGTRACPT